MNFHQGDGHSRRTSSSLCSHIPSLLVHTLPLYQFFFHSCTSPSYLYIFQVSCLSYLNPHSFSDTFFFIDSSFFILALWPHHLTVFLFNLFHHFTDTLHSICKHSHAKSCSCLHLEPQSFSNTPLFTNSTLNPLCGLIINFLIFYLNYWWNINVCIWSAYFFSTFKISVFLSLFFIIFIVSLNIKGKSSAVMPHNARLFNLVLESQYTLGLVLHMPHYLIGYSDYCACVNTGEAWLNQPLV